MKPIPLPSAVAVRRWVLVVRVATVVLAVACPAVIGTNLVIAIRDGRWWVAVLGAVGLAVHALIAVRILAMCRVATSAATDERLDVALLGTAGRRFPGNLALTVPSLALLLVVSLYPLGAPNVVVAGVVQAIVIGQVVLGGIVATLAERAAEGPGWTPWRIGRRK